MRFFVLPMTTLILFFASSKAVAQSSLEGFASGRYEIHKSTTAVTKKKSRSVASETAKDDDDEDDTPAPVVAIAASVSASTEKTKVVDKHVEEPSLTEQAKSLWHGQAQEVRNFYLQEAHPDDIRNNRVEIGISPALVYNDSQSDFSARRYQSYFNGVNVGANLWMTPGLGVSGQALFSLGADMSANDGTSSRVNADYTYMDFGLHFRKFFGISRKARSLETSLLYTDDKTDVPTDSVGRARLHSEGFGLGLKTRIPSSVSYAWVFGAQFFPWLQHGEQSTSGVSSGSDHGSSKVAVDAGGEFKFTRQSQVIWDVSLSSERDSFSGNASSNDSSGNPISNVSVTNTLYMFSLGYRWGN